MAKTNLPCRIFPNELSSYFTLKEGSITLSVWIMYGDFLPNDIILERKGGTEGVFHGGI